VDENRFEQRRVAAVVLAGVVSVALLAVAAGAAAGITREAASDSSLVIAPRVVVRVALAVFGFVVAGAVALTVWAWLPHRGSRRRGAGIARWAERARPSWRAVAIRIAVGSVVLFVGLWALHLWSSPHNDEQRTPPQAASSPERARAKPGATNTDWIILAVAAGGGVIVVGTWLALAKVPQRPPSRPEHPDVAVAEVLDQSLELLTTIADPAAAVIAAYSHMERVFAAAGWPREPWEAPFEFVDRILVDVGAPAVSVAELTGLFERAQFAPHPVDATMRDAAIRAVVELRDEMRSVV
jgi:hypothetical protein